MWTIRQVSENLGKDSSIGWLLLVKVAQIAFIYKLLTEIVNFSMKIIFMPFW